MNIGKKIMEIRKEHNLSQEDLANMFFVTRQTISSWECGKSYPDIETIIKISDKFNISLDKLLKGDVKMVKKIDKKVRLNKYLIITLIVLIIVAIPIGIYGYKKAIKANSVISNILDGYTVMDFDLDEFSFSDDLKVGDYLDYYVYINEFDNDKSIPLYKGIEIKLLRDENNQNVENIRKAKHLIVSVPDAEFKVLTVLSTISSNKATKEIKKSKDKKITINYDLRDKILNKIAIILDGEPYSPNNR